MATLYASKFDLVMLAQSAVMVRFGPDDYGLYNRKFHNRVTGTSLMARGTKAEMEALRSGA